MASSVVCSWLMAACMSVACENESPTSISMLSSNPSLSSRFSKWAARKRKRAFPISSRYAPEFSRIRNLMSSCLAFEPCDNFRRSSSSFSSLALPSSPFFSGDNGAVAPTRRSDKSKHLAHSSNLCFSFSDSGFPELFGYY